MTESQACGPGCGACFAERHEGHDVAFCHQNGRLYTATCHTCGAVYESPSRLMACSPFGILTALLGEPTTAGEETHG